MKFVLGLISLVLVALIFYVYTDKDEKQPQKQTVHKTVKEVTPSSEVETSVEKKVSVKSKPVVQHSVQKERLNVKKTSYSDDKIGEEFTLESIENTDVSEEEKIRMLDDIAYTKSLEVSDEPTLSDEEILKIIDEDLKNGFIQK